jgi:transposase
MSRVEIAMYFNRGTSTIHAWVKQYLAECRREAA